MKLCLKNIRKKIFLNKKKKLIIILIGFLVISMLANVYFGRKMLEIEKNRSHFYMPKSFAYKYPDCANKLIDELGIDNVKIEVINSMEHEWQGQQWKKCI